MIKTLTRSILGLTIIMIFSSWGFYAHKEINKLAVFTLPSEMIGFYKNNIQYITDASTHADQRRFVDKEEAPKHYIDIDHFGDSAIHTMPRYWRDAKEKMGEDTLKAYGILPWNTYVVYQQLKQAFLVGDPERILKLSADLGHYIADAHVPLHTTENYDGQLTGQNGIHAFWESRLPELFADNYNFFTGKASHIRNPQLAIWEIIMQSQAAVDSVLKEEKKLSVQFGEKKYAFETKGKTTQRVYSKEYAKAYHQLLNGMVERRMKASIKMIGDFWYTAWVEAGQPDMKKLIDYKPTEEQLQKRKEEIESWKQKEASPKEAKEN